MKKEYFITKDGERKEISPESLGKLKVCVKELLESHTGSEIVQALGEYVQIVKNVAVDYTNDTTIEELREDHPELNFMDDEELKNILEQAKNLRVPDAAVALGQGSAGQEYKNEAQKCECWKCELQGTCQYKDKYQRLSRSMPGALGLCKKLKERRL